MFGEARSDLIAWIPIQRLVAMVPLGHISMLSQQDRFSVSGDFI